MEIYVNGSINITFINDGVELSKKMEKDVQKKLESGEYVLSLADRSIFEFPEFNKICEFNIEVLEDMEYEFNIFE